MADVVVAGEDDDIIQLNAISISTSGHINPANTDLYDIGTDTKRYRFMRAVSGVFTNLATVGEVSGHIIPNITNLYDIGASTRKFRRIVATSGSFSVISTTDLDPLTIVTDDLTIITPSPSSPPDITSPLPGKSIIIQPRDDILFNFDQVMVHTFSDGSGILGNPTSDWHAIYVKNILSKDNRVQLVSHIQPSSTSSYDVGTSSLEFRTAYAKSGVFSAGVETPQIDAPSANLLLRAPANILITPDTSALGFGIYLGGHMYPNAVDKDIGSSSSIWNSIYAISGIFSSRIEIGGDPVLATSGQLAGTVFPTTDLYDGRQFFRTDLNHMFTYFEGYGGKWLGDLDSDGVGRNGAQTGGSYLRRYNGLLTDASLGLEIPWDITIVGFSWRQGAGAEGSYIVRRDGSDISTINTATAGTGSDMTLNDDFNSGANLSVFWSSVNTIDNPQVQVWWRRRAT